MADQVAGYPTSGLERFVTGFQSGYEKMTDIQKKSAELKTQLALKDVADETLKKKKGGSGDSTTTTREAAYDTGSGTTGSGGGSGGSGGGGGGSGGGGGGGGGEWGSYAAPIMDYFKKAGYSEAAIQGIMANGLAEGGFGNNWKPGDGGTSFGHWQFHEGGELGGYRDWAAKNGVTDLKDSLSQAKFVDYRMQSDPRFRGFKDITDPKAATNQFLQGFERPAPKYNYVGARDDHLGRVQKYMAGGAAPPGPPGMSTGSSEPVPGAPVQMGGPGSEGYGTTSPPAAALPSAFSMKSYGPNLQEIKPEAPKAALPFSRLGAPPQQTSALGGPPGGRQQPQQPPPDIYNRPQAPPPPSVIAQLVGQQYLPQQAALTPSQLNNLYSGLA